MYVEKSFEFFACFSVKCLRFQQIGVKREDHLKVFHKLCFLKSILISNLDLAVSAAHL